MENALGRLDGVKYVSAGFSTETAYVAVTEGQKVDLKFFNKGLESTAFSCLSFEKAN